MKQSVLERLQEGRKKRHNKKKEIVAPVQRRTIHVPYDVEKMRQFINKKLAS